MDHLKVADRKNELNAYLSEGIKTVRGWCIPQLWQTIWPLWKAIGDGPIAEIGVFEGKFLIGLCKTFGTNSGHQAAAIDIFDMQEFNLDGSGIGKRNVLISNLSAHGINAKSVSIVRSDSLSLGASDAANLMREIGKFKFFSVDGCHEVVHTIHDIEFAMSVTDSGGVIAVDDYTNQDWPGVQEAVAKMYLLRDFSFVPFVVTCNKLLLVSYSHHERYLEIVRNYIASSHPETRMKEVRRFGFKTLTVHPNFSSWADLA